MTKTVVAEGYGGPEVLAVQDIVLPHPGEDQVLIDVRAAGTNPVDYKLYSGYMGRDPDNLPMPLGMEVSGIVAAVAPGINGYTGPLNVGDEVIATNVRGGYSERVIADAADVGHKPTPLSFEQAAGLLLAGGTAWHLMTVTRVAEGDTELIHGAGISFLSLLAGGIGIVAVMLIAVRERTREIGLRRALGAKRRDIRLQFMLESTMLAAGGGLAGVAVGLAAGGGGGRGGSVGCVGCWGGGRRGVGV